MLHFRLEHLFLILVLTLGVRLPAFAQDTSNKSDGTAASGDAEGEMRQSAVVIDGETLFSVHGVTAYPADRRAGDIAARIRALAANADIHAGSLTVEEHP